MLNTRDRTIMSFTVFAMFFGAGNLIFPVFLAYSSGTAVIPAFAGFALSSIGLPVLSLIAIGRMGSLDSLASRFHPTFSRIFSTAIYLAIGPCLAIPRTASTSYEMVKAAASLSSPAWQLLYSILFFLAAAIIALRPEKLSSRLGRILSPILVLLIAALFAGSFLVGSAETPPPAQQYASSPFPEGFVEGYQTMDAIAALAFGSILALNIRNLGENNTRKEGIIASIGGGILLLLIYSALAIIGYRSHAIVSSPSTGADILSAAASSVFPGGGRILIAMIFFLACFNTSVGLLSSCGEYFSHLVPRIQSKWWIMLFASVSAITANAGLEAIIRISSPVLEVLYPAAITMVILALAERSRKLRYAFILGISASLVFSVIGIITGRSNLWIIPTATASCIGFLIDMKAKPSPKRGLEQ